MKEAIFAESNHLFSVFHLSIRINVNAVHLVVAFQTFLYLCRVNDVLLRKIFELSVVDVYTVEGYNLALVEMAGNRDEGIIRGCCVYF